MTGNYLKVISEISLIVMVMVLAPSFCYGVTVEEPDTKQTIAGAVVAGTHLTEKADSKKKPDASSEKPDTSSSKKAASRKGKGTLMLNRLAQCREILLSSSVRLQWILGGRIKVLVIGRTKWRKCREAIGHYRKVLGQLMEQPLSSFLYHPRAFVKASEFLKWGRNNAIAVEHDGENFNDVIVVLPDYQRSLVKKNARSAK